MFEKKRLRAELEATNARLAQALGELTVAKRQLRQLPIPIPEGADMTVDNPFDDTQAVLHAFAGTYYSDPQVSDGTPQPWRHVDLLRVRTPGDICDNTTGKPASNANGEGPNASTSVFDQVKTLADIFTARWELNGKTYDTAELIYLIAATLKAG